MKIIAALLISAAIVFAQPVVNPFPAGTHLVPSGGIAGAPGSTGITNVNYAASYCQQANCTNADVVSSAFPVQVSVWTPSYCGFSIPATALGGVAPTGSSLIVEVDKNGVALQTYALTAGQVVGTGLTVSVACGALTGVQGDVITSKITQVGSTLPGRYVTFFASASLAGVTGAAGTNGANGTNGAAGATGPNGATGAISQIQANGTAQTVRPSLDLISGTGATVSCVDNAGATRTECTIAAAGSLSTTATLDLPMGGFNNNSAGLYPAWSITGLSGGKSPDGAIGVQLINTGTPTMSRTFRWPANWAGGTVTVLITASAGGSSGNFGIGLKFACISGGASNAGPTYNASVLVTHIGAGINELELVASSVVTTGCSANQQGIVAVYRDNTVSGNTVDGITISDVAVNYIIQ
jgi:hypothetical protein